LTSQSWLPHLRGSQRIPTATTTMVPKRPSTAHAVRCQRMQTQAIRRGPTCQRSRTPDTRRGPQRLLLLLLAAPWWRALQAAPHFQHLLYRLSSYPQKFALPFVQLSTKNRPLASIGDLWRWVFDLVDILTSIVTGQVQQIVCSVFGRPNRRSRRPSQTFSTLSG